MGRCGSVLLGKWPKSTANIKRVRSPSSVVRGKSRVLLLTTDHGLRTTSLLHSFQLRQDVADLQRVIRHHAVAAHHKERRHVNSVLRRQGAVEASRVIRCLEQ